MLTYPTFKDITDRGFSEREARLMIKSMRENGGHPDLHWQILLGAKPDETAIDLDIDILGREPAERKTWFSK